MRKKKQSTLTEHLEALRVVLIRCLGVLGIGIVPLFFVAPYIIDLLIKAVLGDNSLQLNFFSPLEVFVLQIKTALLADVVVCFPYIIRQVWQFVLPALYEKERKFIKYTVFVSSGLFAVGVLFCLLVIMPMIIRFGISYVTDDIQAVWGLGNIMSLCLAVSFAFGVMFQFPLVTYGLIRFGIFDYATLKSKRSYVLVGVLVLSALLTPPDIVSQLVLAIPTYALFEVGLFFGKSASE